MSDDKIDQEIKILQAVLEKAVSQNPGAAISVVTIGQIRIGTHEEDTPSTSVPLLPQRREALRLPEATSAKMLQAPTERYEDLKILMDKLPKPKLDSLMKLVFGTSCKYCASVEDAADWLGVNKSYIYHWYKKLGLSMKKGR